MDTGFEGAEDVSVGVVAFGAGEDPTDMHIGEVDGPGELAFEGWTAVRDGVAFEEPRRSLDLVGCLADLDRRPQQRGGLGGRFPLDLVARLDRTQVAVDRRAAHRQQLGTHLRAVAVHTCASGRVSSRRGTTRRPINPVPPVTT